MIYDKFLQTLTIFYANIMGLYYADDDTSKPTSKLERLGGVLNNYKTNVACLVDTLHEDINPHIIKTSLADWKTAQPQANRSDTKFHKQDSAIIWNNDSIKGIQWAPPKYKKARSVTWVALHLKDRDLVLGCFYRRSWIRGQELETLLKAIKWHISSDLDYQ